MKSTFATALLAFFGITYISLSVIAAPVPVQSSFEDLEARGEGHFRGAHFHAKPHPHHHLGRARAGHEERDVTDELEVRHLADVADLPEARDVEDMESRDVEELIIRDIADEDLVLAIRSSWENMNDVERRSFWKKIKKGIKKVGNFAKKAIATGAKIVGSASKIASSFGIGGPITGIIGKASNFIGKAQKFEGALGMRSFEGEDIFDIRDLADEHLALAARAAFEDMLPMERREWIDQLGIGA